MDCASGRMCLSWIRITRLKDFEAHYPIFDMEKTLANKALHRTAICAWGFALELLVVIIQFVPFGELGR